MIKNNPGVKFELFSNDSPVNHLGISICCDVATFKEYEYVLKFKYLKMMMQISEI